jgi:hypothetical protein
VVGDLARVVVGGVGGRRVVVFAQGGVRVWEGVCVIIIQKENGREVFSSIGRGGAHMSSFLNATSEYGRRCYGGVSGCGWWRGKKGYSLCCEPAIIMWWKMEQGVRESLDKDGRSVW